MAFRSAARSGGITRRVTCGRPAGCRSYSVLGGTLLALFLLLVAGRQASAQLPDAPVPVVTADPLSAPPNEVAAAEPGWSSSNSGFFQGERLSAAFLNARMAPRAPRPRRRDEILTWSALAADASMRGLDAYSTTVMLDHGCHEMILPNFIASHPSTMSAFGASVVVLNYFSARKLGRRHPFMRWLVPAADAASTGSFAIHNFFLKSPRTAAKSGPAPILPPHLPIPMPEMVHLGAH